MRHHTWRKTPEFGPWVDSLSNPTCCSQLDLSLTLVLETVCASNTGDPVSNEALPVRLVSDSVAAEERNTESAVVPMEDRYFQRQVTLRLHGERLGDLLLPCYDDGSCFHKELASQVRMPQVREVLLLPLAFAQQEVFDRPTRRIHPRP